MFALVDCNSCYASCEQIFRPDLRDKPVIVLSNNDGCIIARSKEAKRLGIPDLQPYFKLKGFLQQQGVNVFSANFTLYGDISHRVMTTLREYAAEVEVYSIDEMFLSFDGLPDDLKAYGQKIKQRVWRDVRMPVSVGVAPTKTLSKLANHAAKKISRLDGVCLLDTPEKWQWVQARLPVTKVWGVGSRTGKRLNAMGITSILDLARADPKHMRREFNVNIERTIAELNGTPAIDMETETEPRQQIYCTRSFGYKPGDLYSLQTSISAYAARAAEKLREQNSHTKTLQVFISCSRFEEEPYHGQQVVELPYATDDTRVLCHYARLAVKQLYRPNRVYARAGVGLLDIRSKDFQQQDFFYQTDNPRSEALMKTLDKINRRYGHGSTFIAAEGQKKRWRMRQDFLSPAYTTRWQDIPKVML